jgi:hypothetical protein
MNQLDFGAIPVRENGRLYVVFYDQAIQGCDRDGIL